MIPSSEAVAENVKKHVDAMAKEVVRRCTAEDKGSTYLYREMIERHVREVMVDWLLGDWVPPPPEKPHDHRQPGTDQDTDRAG